jgi:hypothetical protein
VRRRASKLTNLIHARAGAREARRIIERGVQALGGEENLSRYKALNYKGKVESRRDGRPEARTCECVLRYPDRCRMTIEVLDGHDKGLVFITAFDQGHGWYGFASAPDRKPASIFDLDESQIDAWKGILHREAVSTLTPLLKDKPFTLSLGTDTRVGRREVHGVVVSHRGHPDVNLFFDAKSGLLLKYETRARIDGKEKTLGYVLSDYKDVEGTRRPHRIVTHEDGRETAILEVVEYKALEDVDDREFARP